jgi:hypothetical protein
MTELESGLNKVLEEHQHESGLHIIGGRKQLIARLAEFFQQIAQSSDQASKQVGQQSN